MIRVTTQDIDFTQSHEIHVTLRQRSTVLDFFGADLTIMGNRIEVYPSQEQSLKLAAGECEIQVNGLTTNDQRWASKVKTIEITKQLLREVIG